MKSLIASIVGVIVLCSQTTAKAEKVYVLKFKTRGWVQIDYQFQKTTNSLIGQGVNDKLAEAKALGFGTKRKVEHTPVLFGTDSYRTYAYAKRDNWKEKTFSSKAERKEYLKTLLKVVPSYTNDGPGLNFKEETRDE